MHSRHRCASTLTVGTESVNDKGLSDRLVNARLCLQEGEVVERGTHAELVAHRGLYAEMWARQAEATRAGDRASAGSLPDLAARAGMRGNASVASLAEEAL